MKRSEMSAAEKRLEQRLTRVAGRSGLRVGRNEGGYYLQEQGTGRQIIDCDGLDLEQLRERLQGPRTV